MGPHGQTATLTNPGRPPPLLRKRSTRTPRPGGVFSRATTVRTRRGTTVRAGLEHPPGRPTVRIHLRLHAPHPRKKHDLEIARPTRTPQTERQASPEHGQPQRPRRMRTFSTYSRAPRCADRRRPTALGPGVRPLRADPSRNGPTAQQHTGTQDAVGESFDPVSTLHESPGHARHVKTKPLRGRQRRVLTHRPQPWGVAATRRTRGRMESRG